MVLVGVRVSNRIERAVAEDSGCDAALYVVNFIFP